MKNKIFGFVLGVALLTLMTGAVLADENFDAVGISSSPDAIGVSHSDGVIPSTPSNQPVTPIFVRLESDAIGVTPIPPQDSGNSGGGGSIGRRIGPQPVTSSGFTPLSTEDNGDENSQNDETINSNQDNGRSWLTGAVVGIGDFVGSKTGVITIIAVIVGLLVLNAGVRAKRASMAVKK